MKTKLDRFLTNVRYLGDVGKAAAKTRVSRSQLDQWMADWAIAAEIDKALRDALIISHDSDSADDILFRAKVAPQLEKDGEFFRQTGQRERESKIIAKLAAKDLRKWRWDIAQAAHNTDRKFFIDLGRVLSSDASGELYGKLDADITEIHAKHPTISIRKTVIELERRGHSSLEEQTVRTRKSRLGLTKRKSCKL